MNTANRPPQEKVCGYEYTVKRGDSFYLIAHRLGVPLRDLLEANADINPARLMVGDVLCIPMEEDDVPQPETQMPAQPPVEEPAEELPPATEIPENEPVPLPELNGEEIIEEEIGEMTPELLPEDSLDMPATEPDNSAPDSDPPVDCSGSRYRVAEGETAADIQLDRGLSFHTLQAANPDVCLDRLAAGAELCIPEANIPCPLADTYSIQAGETLESVALKLNVSLGSLLRANPCLAPADFAEGVCIVVP